MIRARFVEVTRGKWIRIEPKKSLEAALKCRFVFRPLFRYEKGFVPIVCDREASRLTITGEGVD